MTNRPDDSRGEMAETDARHWAGAPVLGPMRPEPILGTSVVCFFLISGHTFTFREAVVITDNETIIVVRYRAMSDGKTKRATFYKSALAGISVAI